MELITKAVGLLTELLRLAVAVVDARRTRNHPEASRHDRKHAKGRRYRKR